MAIAILVDEPFRSLVPTSQLKAAIVAALEFESAEGDVTLVITDDEAIAALNRRFLGKEGPTDVLSFPAQDEGNAFALPPDSPSYLGDIVIAYPYAAAQARSLNRPVTAELSLLTVHGVLHLLGYDHAEPEEREVMWDRQERILAGLRSS